ncbi:cytochrome c [Thioalkalivibrio sp. ALJ16]|uniref:c-type cytochrome n=1 Tax=Thioalkalivibrio sp. ALJ16 TaxID=1158762 RepID=UPI0003774B31|nr:cytochrome c [Thioalkalivibrio sp. ALJ16]
MRRTHAPIAAGAAALALSLAGANAALADDIRAGQELHGDNCISCHADMVGGDGSGLYTRENRMVGSHDELVAQVNNCNVNLGTNWFDDEVDAVVAYLNAEYYQFDE